MSIDEALTTYLLAQSGLTALIGRRLFPDETPEEVDLRSQTAVVYKTISDIPDYFIDRETDLAGPIYQWTAFAPTRKKARAIAAQIRAALTDYSGMMSGIFVQHIRRLNEIPQRFATSDGAVRVWSVTLEYQITYTKE